MRSFWTLYGSPLLLIAACVMTVVAVARRPDVSATDFRTFYQSGQQLLAGTDPYSPFDSVRGPNLNPPWVVGIMAPLSRAPLAAAVAAWWVFSFVCLFAAIVLIARAAVPGHGVTVACLLLVTQAAYSNVRLGQVAWPVMLVVTAAWIADRSRRPIAAGLLLGVAMSWKPFLLVFVPYLVWRNAWRTLAAVMAALTVTAAIGAAMLGVGSYASWIGMLRIVGWAGHPLNASVRALVTRAVTVSTLAELQTSPITNAPAWLEPAWLLAATAVATATALFVVRHRDRIDMAWAALLLSALLISPLGWVHYAAIVVGPVVAVVWRAPLSARRLAVAGWLLLCVPFVWLKSTTFGPALTLTIASAYTWGTLLLLAAVFASASANVSHSRARRLSSSSTQPRPPSTSV